MRNKLATLAAVLGLLLTGLALSPPAAAEAPSPAVSAAVPIMPPQLVWYDDHQGQPIRLTHKASDEISRSNVLDCSSTGTVKYLTLLDASRISAVLLWVPSGQTKCNYLYVTNLLGVTWGMCINKYRSLY